MSIEAAIARLDEKLEARNALLVQYMEDQERRWLAQIEHNRSFYATRDVVNEKVANAKGAWWTIGIFGVLTTAVSSVVAWWVSK